MTGPEMMLKALGIDAKQIEGVVNEIVAGLRDNNARMKRLEEKLERLENHLIPPPAPHYEQPRLTFNDEDSLNA